ncbi:co-chaperone GroES [Leisingera methylohalidivorans]|uniref:Molecular chaperone GroES n=1 Tax=Leisingera methylohalidivorans DSM 14336 TaxID=999552 RepID=V9VZA1_9RHOB|nr:co-chaperone GroES [Leisingera methylohalidivorans]AHD02222.1 molecular chaperone GroES [Leisingera methylohalidivorans DSM 14336]
MFKPLHDRVLLRRIEGDEKTKGDRISVDVKTGDRILFGKWSGSEIKIDGEDRMIMKESDILGIIA